LPPLTRLNNPWRLIAFRGLAAWDRTRFDGSTEELSLAQVSQLRKGTSWRRAAKVFTNDLPFIGRFCMKNSNIGTFEIIRNI
jgi:hypothetical protein